MVLRQSSRIPLLVICGPTASGKTALALELAERWPFEVVSADSRQVYRTMDIGTAKPTPAELRRLRHHLVDVVDPEDEFSAADFVRLGHAAIADVVARGKLPVLVGGTGLYIQALTEGLLDAPGADAELRRQLLADEAAGGAGTLHRRLAAVDPVSAARLPPRNLVRIVRALEVYQLSGRPLSDLQAEHGFADQPYRLLVLGLTAAREELYRRIDRRSEQMFAAGLIEETRALLERSVPPECKSLRTIGYREVVRLLSGDIDQATALTLVQRETRRYAKRQLTWFAKTPEIIWVDSSQEFGKIPSLIEHFYAS
jgi:tRNA dimethylallyltransferase